MFLFRIFSVVTAAILRTRFHACPFVLLCEPLWDQPCMNFMIFQAVMHGGICRCKAYNQRVSYMCTVIHPPSCYSSNYEFLNTVCH